VAQGCKDFEAVVVVAGPLTPPCGMCRQAIAEFNPRVPVRLYSLDGHRDTIATLDLYLPNPFLG
jgi:cytidine deaminase